MKRYDTTGDGVQQKKLNIVRSLVYNWQTQPHVQV